jgi:uncharacterized membrane protein
VRDFDYLFGKKLATRVTMGIFYIAWLSMLPGFFTNQGRWLNLSTWLVCLSFFIVGLFLTFADRESLIDIWKADSRIGRELADPIRGKMMQWTMRLIGIGFMIVILYVGYEMLHR